MVSPLFYSQYWSFVFSLFVLDKSICPLINFTNLFKETTLPLLISSIEPLFTISLVITFFIVSFYLLSLGSIAFLFPSFSRWRLRLMLFSPSVITMLLFGFQLLATRGILIDRLQLHSIASPFSVHVSFLWEPC